MKKDKDNKIENNHHCKTQRRKMKTKKIEHKYTKQSPKEKGELQAHIIWRLMQTAALPPPPPSRNC